LGWRIEFDPRAEKELSNLPRKDQERIVSFLQKRVVERDSPRIVGAPLRGPEFGRFWKYRVGPYRIICAIRDGTLVVFVIRGHRRDVYLR